MSATPKRRIVCMDAGATSLLIRKYLLEQAGHEVLTATDLDSGLRLLGEHTPDVMVIDESLARTAKARVKDAKTRERVPVLLISDMPYPDAELRACADVIVWRAEPVDVLLQKVQELMIGNLSS